MRNNIQAIVKGVIFVLYLTTKRQDNDNYHNHQKLFNSKLW